MKAKTIDEICNKPAGSFKKFVEQKKGFLQKLENERKERIRGSRKSAYERKERIRGSRKSAYELSWAA
jgi:hypothetical protein